ncbi:MAG: glycoside hydrolase family 3 N-terminal domain-containing protein, partial [Novosphingobium sp.]
IEDIIRGRIGFDGFLMSDDLDMKALDGEIGALAAASVSAGCDAALNCWGRMDEMVSIAGKVGALSAKADARLARAMTTIGPAPDGAQLAELLAKRDALLQLAA